MKINATVLLKLSRKEVELVNEQYTKVVGKIITSELSIQEINELIEKIVVT
jgi:hypothetical protein